MLYLHNVLEPVIDDGFDEGLFPEEKPIWK